MLDKRMSQPPQNRTPYIPSKLEWSDCYEMLCGHCAYKSQCEIVEEMIQTQGGGQWPEGGWVHDEGGIVTCLSYQPKKRPPYNPDHFGEIIESDLLQDIPQCGGCAATKGSSASKCFHTQKDFAASVKNKSAFLCHETGLLCGGWLRAIAAKERAKNE